MPFEKPSATLATPGHPIERLPGEWEALLAEWDEPRYRGAQIFKWIHARGVLDPSAMSDLPKRLRDRLSEVMDPAPLTIADKHETPDGTRKLLLSLHGGESVEAVLIPQLSKQDLDAHDNELEATGPAHTRVTQCISSEVGCAMGCVFCASGAAGLKRKMAGFEIISQVLIGRNELHDHERLRNVVFMGMGEPLNNYDAVARAWFLCTHPDGIGLSTRHVTISTSGLVPEIDQLGHDFHGKVALAVSLHAVDDDRRSALMPINRKYPLKELIAALRRYPLPRRRRITIEYTLIADVNDDPNDAQALVRLLRGVPIKVNLIPMNAVPWSPLRAPTIESVHAFQTRLFDLGVPTFVRKRRGDEIAAACGQLALHGGTPRAALKKQLATLS